MKGGYEDRSKSIEKGRGKGTGEKGGVRALVHLVAREAGTATVEAAMMSRASHLL